jgi:hypothetical protein
VEGVEPHEAKARADPRHGVSQGQRVGVGVCGRLEQRACSVVQALIVVGAPGQVDGDALGHGGSGTAVGKALPVGFGGDLRADLGPMVLTLGGVDMGQPCSALVQQVGAAASAGTGRTPRRWRDRGLREQATAEHASPRVGIDRLVCGCATVHGLQREGMPQDKGQALGRPEVGQPVPGQQTRAGHDEPRAVWGESLQQGGWSGWHRAVEQDVSIVTHEADVQASGVLSDTTGTWVLVGGASVP